MTLKDLKIFTDKCSEDVLGYEIVIGVRNGDESWKIEKLHPLFRVRSDEEAKEIIFDIKPLI